MKKIIPVVFSLNKKYLPYAKVAINSLIRRSSSKIKLYCFGLDLQDSDFNYFRNLAKEFNAEFEGVHFKSDDVSHFSEMLHLTKATYLRLYIPKFVKEDKVIYIDCDILFLKDITELFNIPFEDNYVLAVEDWMYQNRNQYSFAQDRAEKLELNDVYVNSGVLVLNNKVLKDIDFQQKCVEIYNKYNEVIEYADQCIINKLFENRKKTISEEWNFQFFANRYDLDLPPDSVLHNIGGNKMWMEHRVMARHHYFWVQEALSYGLKREELGIQDGD